jgi:hypothetical protein
MTDAMTIRAPHPHAPRTRTYTDVVWAAPMRILTAALCIAAPYAGMSAEYEVTDAWPSGQGEGFVRMDPANGPLCIAVSRATVSHAAIQSPVSCQNPIFYQSSALRRPAWSPVDDTKVLGLAKTLERLFEDSLHWTSYPSNKPEFLEGMAQRWRAHTLTVATTTVTPAGHNEYVTLKGPGDQSSQFLRYERWSCSESPKIAGPRVLFFIVEGKDIASMKLLDGGGDSPDDLFLFDGQAYFSSLSERVVDSRWKNLQQPQPELHVHNLYNESRFVQICNLLYWDRESQINR